MKSLIATVLTLSAMNSFAASVKLHEQIVWTRPQVQGSFGINEEMGRAWVELAIHTSSFTDSDPDYVRVKVPGLSVVGGSVVLDVEGQQVECAKIKPVGIFRYRIAKATGLCKFTSKVEKRVQDDGFETREVKVLTVNLVTK